MGRMKIRQDLNGIGKQRLAVSLNRSASVIRGLAKKLQDCREMLKRLEWNKLVDDGHLACSVCGGENSEHRPGCELDALLKDKET